MRPKVGDAVLWFGLDLEVTAITEVKDGAGNPVQQVVVDERQHFKEREEAIAEIQELRKIQAALKPKPGRKELSAEDLDKHYASANRIRELDALCRESFARAKLRIDSLAYWEERGVWVSDGRILNNDQIKHFKRMTGSKPTVYGQRAALALPGSQKGA